VTLRRAARLLLDARERGASTVLALVLEGPAEGERRLLVREPDGTLHSPTRLSVAHLDRAVDLVQRDAMEARPHAPSGVRVVEHSGGPTRIYLEHHRPPPGLLIVGAGHIAEPLHLQGALLGFDVTVVDDRPDFVDGERFPHARRVVQVDFSDPFATLPPPTRSHVVLVTRGHKYDYECLRRLLRLDLPPEYIGMIGSRRRVRATFHQLLEEGIPTEALARIHAPVGLDIGAETPSEIAVAVAAEWVRLRRGGSGRSLVEVERIAERFFPEEALP